MGGKDCSKQVTSYYRNVQTPIKPAKGNHNIRVFSRKRASVSKQAVTNKKTPNVQRKHNLEANKTSPAIHFLYNSQYLPPIRV